MALNEGKFYTYSILNDNSFNPYLSYVDENGVEFNFKPIAYYANGMLKDAITYDSIGFSENDNCDFIAFEAKELTQEEVKRIFKTCYSIPLNSIYYTLALKSLKDEQKTRKLSK